MSDYLNAINFPASEEDFMRFLAQEAGLGNYPFHANQWETLEEWIDRMAEKHGLRADLVLKMIVISYPDNFLCRK